MKFHFPIMKFIPLGISVMLYAVYLAASRRGIGSLREAVGEVGMIVALVTANLGLESTRKDPES